MVEKDTPLTLDYQLAIVIAFMQHFIWKGISSCHRVKKTIVPLNIEIADTSQTI